MPNPRAVLISLIIAGLAVLLVWSFVNQQKTSLLELTSAQKVVVANQDINAFTMINETMLRVDSVPKSYVQPGTYTEIQDIIGLIASVPIKQGEQILQNKVLFEATQTKLSTRIIKGKRAITVPVSDIHGVGKLIKPGDRVDLLSSIDYGQGDREKREVKTILQDILVIATGRNVMAAIHMEMTPHPITGEMQKTEPRKDYATVTLEVTPEEAQGVVFLLSSGTGAVFLSLRNTDDRSIEKLYTTNETKILGPRSSKGRQPAGIKSRGQPQWLDFRGTQF